MKTRLIIFVLLLLTWTPISGFLQFVSYAGPLAVVMLGILLGVVGISRIDFPLLGIGALLALLGSIFYRDTGWVHPALGLLTYSSLMVLAVRFRNTAVARRAFINYTTFFSIFEGTTGILQLLLQEGGLRFQSSMAAGDAVVGTLGTNAHLFAVKLLFQGMFLLYVWQHTRKVRERGVVRPGLLLAAAGVAFVAALLASALISTAVFVLTIFIASMNWRSFIASLLHMRMRPLWILFGTGSLMLLFFFLYTQERNAALIMRSFSVLVRSGPQGNPITFQKLLAFQVSVEEVLLDDVRSATWGVGLGRYSSRAAMILSGGYLRNHPELIPISRSPATDEHIYPRWNREVWHVYRGSIMGMPTNSVQSVLIEFGILGSMLIFWYFALIVRRARRLQKQRDGLGAVYLRIVLPFVLALWMVSLTDLWLEYPQCTVFVYLVVAIALSREQPVEAA